jgi:hypothetical protein
MPIFDDTLRPMVEHLTVPATAIGLVRQRGGIARGVAWAEVSGRLVDQSWGELRLFHKPLEQRVQAGLLIYTPLAYGGRTLVVGETSLTYRIHPAEVEGQLVTTLERWLQRLQGAHPSHEGTDLALYRVYPREEGPCPTTKT